MAAAYRSSSSTTYASRTNTVLTAPAGIQNGDVLLLVCLLGGSTTPTPTPPAGFTALTGFPVTRTSGGFTVKTYAWYKVASGESGNYTVTHTSASSQGFIAAVSGADASNPISPNPTIATGTGTTSTATGLTTLVDNSLVFFLQHDWGDYTNNLTPPTGSTPTFTERMDTSIMYVASGVLATAGATGNKSITNNSNSTGLWMASLIAIRAAATASSPTVTTQAATFVNLTSATCNGTVVSDGGSAITERGICWGTSANPTTAGSHVAVAGTTGSFSADLTGLTTGTVYHCRAYAINSVGTSYGADIQFTPQAPFTAVGAQNTSQTAGATSLSLTLTGVQAHSTIAVVVDYMTGVTLTGVSDGAAYTATPHSPFDSGLGMTTSIWYRQDVAAGDYTITASFSASNHVAMFATEIQGAATTAVVRTDNSGSGTSQNITGVPISGVQDGDFLFGVVVCNGTVTSVGAPYSSDSTEHQVIWAADVAAGSYSFNYTQDSSQAWGGVLAAFKAAPPTGGTVWPLAGTASGAANAAAQASASRALAGHADGAAMSSGAVGVIRRVIGTAAAMATAAAVLVRLKPVSGATSGQAIGLGRLSATRGTSGLTSGTASGVGILFQIRRLAGFSIASATTSAKVKLLKGVSGGAVAVSSGTGKLVAIRRAAGMAVGVSSGLASLFAIRSLKGAASGLSAGFAAIVGTAQVLVLAGVTAGQAACLAILTAVRAAAGLTAGRASGTGLLTRIYGLGGATAGISGGTGILNWIRGLAGSILGSSSTAAVPSVIRVLGGVAAGISSLVGTLLGVEPAEFRDLGALVTMRTAPVAAVNLSDSPMANVALRAIPFGRVTVRK